MKKERVFVFIDGFNLYHAVSRHLPNRYKWCDLRKLAEQFIDPKRQKIGQIYYFTAYSYWDEDQKSRHKKYTKALQYHCHVYSILGAYRKVTRRFLPVMPVSKCVPESVKKLIQLLVYETHEEKETDVNLAIKILEDAFLDNYDHAILVSGDSDLVSAIRTVKKHFPTKKFTSLLPIKAKGKIIQKACDERKQITQEHLHMALLPEQITLPSGEVIVMPVEYAETTK